VRGGKLSGIVKEYRCESVVDFWKLVAPSSDLWSFPLEHFIFRGQSDATWKLTPRVYRPEVLKKYKVGMMQFYADHPGQTIFEWSLLSSFVHYCDERGLPVADDGHQFREQFDFQKVTMANGSGNKDWPQPYIHSVMALAQHHGVPTRLLDWSRNSLIACYFAAAGVLTSINPAAELAVFAMTYKPSRATKGYRHVKVPGSTTPNIAAQKGTFLLVDNAGLQNEAFTPGVSLEDKIAIPDQLFKFTLPTSQAGELLRMCELYDVSAASVFPGYDGAAQAVSEWIFRIQD